MENFEKDSLIEQAYKALNTAFFNKVSCTNPVDCNILFFRYMYLHDKFAEEGIFITERNKEEKYIEIIEKDSPELLELLEEYLQVIEELQEISSVRDLWKEKVDQLVELSKTEDKDNKEKILDIIRPFFARVDGKFREEVKEDKDE